MSIADDPAIRLCARCGYDLRGLPAARCPECGLPFDPDAPPPPAIPWVRRQELGLISAYAQTVEMVVLHPKKFAEQAWRWTDVNPVDGEQFRRLTVVVAAAALAALSAFAGYAHDYSIPNRMPLVSFLAFGLVVLAGSLTFLGIATLRVPISFPNAREGFELRFAALQKYCCAGLAITVIVAATGILTAILVAMNDGKYGALQLVGFCLYAISLFGTLIAWMAGCGMYLAFAGHVDAKTWVIAIAKSAVLWMIAIVATVMVCISLQFIFEKIGW